MTYTVNYFIPARLILGVGRQNNAVFKPQVLPGFRHPFAFRLMPGSGIYLKNKGFLLFACTCQFIVTCVNFHTLGLE